MEKTRWWINRDAMLLVLSAFFADMGYQAVLAGLPIFIVVFLGAPVYFLGLAYALAYGVGAIFGTLGGIIGDRAGRKRISILGNAFILLLPLLTFASSVSQALLIFATGWWAREFRTPPRRAMLSEATTKKERPRAYGLLHVFDIGGGTIAVGYLLLLLYLKFSIQSIFIFTALPISISTICLVFVRAGRKRISEPKASVSIHAGLKKKASNDTLKGILVATALFGFSFYSLGFPILTIAEQSGNSTLGILSYLIYLMFSAAAGYTIGSQARRLNMVKGLAFLGYALAAASSLILALYYAMQLSIAVSYLAVALLGIAVGTIETFEPTIISLISKKSEQGKKMGYLTSSRSIGLFAANVGMGLLYSISPAYSYLYASALAVAASAVLLYSGRNFR